MSATKSISVVFLGSGPVAAKSLELLMGDFTIEAVITKPRPAHHRGPVPVLDLYERCASAADSADGERSAPGVASTAGTPGAGPHPLGRLITVSTKRELAEAVAGAGFGSRLGVVIDFGIIIPQEVIDAFPLGIINSHFSLLPEWRGADPITFSILSGQQQTGVSLMRITAGLDEGPLLSFGVYEMTGSETTPSLTDYLIKLSHALLTHRLPDYLEHPEKVVPQERAAQTLGHPTTPTFSRKLTKEDGILDFSKPAEVLEREVRAYAGWPQSRTRIAGRDVIVTAAHVGTGAELTGVTGEPGTLWRDNKSFGIWTPQGVLVIDRLKPAGKQDMPAAAFMAGYQL